MLCALRRVVLPWRTGGGASGRVTLGGGGGARALGSSAVRSKIDRSTAAPSVVRPSRRGPKDPTASRARASPVEEPLGLLLDQSPPLVRPIPPHLQLSSASKTGSVSKATRAAGQAATTTGRSTRKALKPKTAERVQVPAIPARPVKLNDGTFRFAALETSVEEFVETAGSFTDAELADFPAWARADRIVILATFRAALALPEHERLDFLRAQDEAQEEARRPPISLQPTPRAIGRAWQTADLDAALDAVLVDARQDGTPLLRKLESSLAAVSRLTEPDLSRFRSTRERLFALARTAEEVVEVANWLVRVTRLEANASDLLYVTVNGVIHIIPHIRPATSPAPYLAFILGQHGQAITKAFSISRHPLLTLLEVYTTLYRHERDRLDPFSPSPALEVLKEFERLRLRHLDAVQQIRLAIGRLGPGLYTQRSAASLMAAYGQASSFADAHAIWTSARSKHGVGVGQQGVAMYFDACGFSGALPEALAAWKELRQSNFTLNENNYASYHECLNRCGAWDDLVVSIRDQQTRHAADPAMTPPITPFSLALAVRFARRLVLEPRRRSLYPVDLAKFKKLRAELKALAGEELWDESRRLLKSDERYPKASKTSPQGPASVLEREASLPSSAVDDEVGSTNEVDDADALLPATNAFSPLSNGPAEAPPPLSSSGSRDAVLLSMAPKPMVVVPVAGGRVSLPPPPLTVPGPPRSPAVDPFASASPAMDFVAPRPPSPIVQPVVVPVENSADKLARENEPSVFRRVFGLANGVVEPPPPTPPASPQARKRARKKAKAKEQAEAKEAALKKTARSKVAAKRVASQEVVPSSPPRLAETVNVAPAVFVKLNDGTFRFADLDSSVEDFLETAEAATDEELADFPAWAKADRNVILSTFRSALALPEHERLDFLRAQDRAQDEARRPPISLQPTPRVTGRAWQIADLDAALDAVTVDARPDGTPLLRKLENSLAAVGRLTSPNPLALRSTAERLFDLARTAEEVVEVANWLVRVTRQEANASDLLYLTVNGLIQAVLHIRPGTSPAPYLAFLGQHERAVNKTFTPARHPLPKLLEVHTTFLKTERDRLDPLGQYPSAAVLDELRRLRVRHLDTVQQIRQAMDRVGPGLYTRRSAASLMDAYGYGHSFADAQAIWTSARGENGVGVDRQGVSMYFDVCGFNGALSEALAAWKDLRDSKFAMDENNYAAYHECLNRCGAWTDLIDAITDQQTRHAANPANVPLVTPSQLAHAVKLANRLVKEPRHRSLYPVDLAKFKKLRAELKALAGPEMWTETERVMTSKEPFVKASRTLPPSAVEAQSASGEKIGHSNSEDESRTDADEVPYGLLASTDFPTSSDETVTGSFNPQSLPPLPSAAQSAPAVFVAPPTLLSGLARARAEAVSSSPPPFFLSVESVAQPSASGSAWHVRSSTPSQPSSAGQAGSDRPAPGTQDDV